MHRNVWEKSRKWVFTQVSFLDGKLDEQLYIAKAILDQIAVGINEIIATRNACLRLLEKFGWVLIW